VMVDLAELVALLDTDASGTLEVAEAAALTGATAASRTDRRRRRQNWNPPGHEIRRDHEASRCI